MESLLLNPRMGNPLRRDRKGRFLPARSRARGRSNPDILHAVASAYDTRWKPRMPLAWREHISAGSRKATNGRRGPRAQHFAWRGGYLPVSRARVRQENPVLLGVDIAELGKAAGKALIGFETVMVLGQTLRTRFLDKTGKWKTLPQVGLDVALAIGLGAGVLALTKRRDWANAVALGGAIFAAQKLINWSLLAGRTLPLVTTGWEATAKMALVGGLGAVLPEQEKLLGAVLPDAPRLMDGEARDRLDPRF
jgi:hypothetical protein